MVFASVKVTPSLVLLSTLPYTTLKDTNTPLNAAVVVWKLIFDTPSIGLAVKDSNDLLDITHNTRLSRATGIPVAIVTVEAKGNAGKRKKKGKVLIR